MNQPVVQILSAHDVHPVLVDVGASWKPPDIWADIKALSQYVGFDPDQREIYVDRLSGFHRKVMINKAVTCDPAATNVKFHLTASPFCSSTLLPNPPALAPYIYAEEYVIEREAIAEAVTLQAALDQLALTRLDWLKLDTQGTDLQIFRSLEERTQAGVLALDIEPGMTEAYANEDMFGEAHAWLINNGFWLSDLKPCGTIRIRPATWKRVQGSRGQFAIDCLFATFKKTPCWCEARYFRTLDWLKDHEAKKVDYLMLWSFSLLDDQIGFALDVAVEFDRVFGSDETAHFLWDEALRLLERRRIWLPLESPKESLKLILPKSVKQVIKVILSLLKR